MNQRDLFLRHVAQTSEAPLALEFVRAEGSYLWDAKGKRYIDLIGGISVCNVGHRHPAVVAAIKDQADRYLHTMVYGETVQTPQVGYARLLAEHLPPSLNCVYFTNSGTEAVEGAMKLAKRATGRTEIVGFLEAYHGSSQGALSLMGDEYWRNAFRPLLPGIHHLRHNDTRDLARIGSQTACVVLETIQGEAGVRAPDAAWMRALRERCDQVGALLVLDEIQCGFGRNGTLWAFEQYGIVPDILLLGKALGGGMPLGAFVADRSLMYELASKPVLGHITTFGGHPVSCAAGMAAMRALLAERMVEGVAERETWFRTALENLPGVRALRSRGLMIALEFDSFETNKQVIDRAIAAGVFTDWFLHSAQSMRIVPPLNISREDVQRACEILALCISS
ncbi:MAG TPA: aminotransferase class III-fold pyridoxal phosphate-dependent enzyme [Dinghuibacter sp.]|uniref:aspartate aminotransferase family protein n=1 Tax=Dinghuibacter sp. TaxID=2024697 RepID=UPI002BC5BAB6|nr:aminotransferase class III-fold pyridoxal phosphate-dependent enzyme [Dinghuibacter sp.]HTJ12750.1 aminotransferase class III-fold pyridoxal phosphate-dependent enzyme [Dinghuibacter sp.]